MYDQATVRQANQELRRNIAELESKPELAPWEQQMLDYARAMLKIGEEQER